MNDRESFARNHMIVRNPVGSVCHPLCCQTLGRSRRSHDRCEIYSKEIGCVKSVSQIFVLPTAGRDIPNNAGIVIGQNVLYSMVWENSKSRAKIFDFVEDKFDDDWSIEAIFAKWLPQLRPFFR